jgi:hypothetical protein
MVRESWSDGKGPPQSGDIACLRSAARLDPECQTRVILCIRSSSDDRQMARPLTMSDLQGHNHHLPS